MNGHGGQSLSVARGPVSEKILDDHNEFLGSPREIVDDHLVDDQFD